MNIKTDGQVMDVARKIDKLREEIGELISSVQNGDHPNAEQLAEALHEQCYFPAWATHVIMDHLQRPDAWMCDTHSSGFSLSPHHIASRKAAQARRAKRITSK